MDLLDYEVLSIIGTGSFGVCYKVKSKKTNDIFVWKAIDYGDMSEDKRQLLVSEVNLLKGLKHPNIVQYHDRIIHKETQTLYIIMECCEQGDLSKLISKCKDNFSYMEEKFIWRVLYQTAKALQACHSHKSKLTVLHRDIKPANVFLDNDGNVKLGDFGLARVVNKNSFADTFVGTPNYMSPEVIQGAKYNRKSDIWSLGCLVYEMCALRPPFFSDNFSKLSDNIKEGKFKRIPKYYSEELFKMIKFMLSVDFTYRPTVEVIIHHPTVVSNLHTDFKLPKLIKDNVKRQSFLEKLNSSDKYPEDGLHLVTKQKLTHRATKSDSESILQETFVGTLSKAIEKAGNNLELSKNPSDISSDTFKDAWLRKLEDVRQREVNVKILEKKMSEREIFLDKREKQIDVLDKLAKEKIAKAELLLKNYRITKCLRPRRKQQKLDYLDLDSTLSADTGDTSIIMPTSRLNPILEKTNDLAFDKNSLDVPVHFQQKTNIEMLKQAIDNKTYHMGELIPQNARTSRNNIKKKSLLSMFKSNKQNSIKNSIDKDVEKNKENEVPIMKIENRAQDLFFKSNEDKTSVWNADNKKAAFELLAALNAASSNNINIKQNQLFRIDNRRKSMIVLKKDTAL